MAVATYCCTPSNRREMVQNHRARGSLSESCAGPEDQRNQRTLQMNKILSKRVRIHSPRHQGWGGGRGSDFGQSKEKTTCRRRRHRLRLQKARTEWESLRRYSLCAESNDRNVPRFGGPPKGTIRYSFFEKGETENQL